MDAPALCSFVCRKSPAVPDCRVLHHPGTPATAPPVFSATVSQTAPHVALFTGMPDPCLAIAGGDMSMCSSKLKLHLRGQPLTLKMSGLSGNFSFDYPGIGALKWKISQLGGSTMRLVDGNGVKLAQYKSTGFLSSEKMLDMYIQRDGLFVEMVVLTALAAREMTKMVQEVASEVGQAVASV